MWPVPGGTHLFFWPCSYVTGISAKVLYLPLHDRFDNLLGKHRRKLTHIMPIRPGYDDG
jgi:hypothetical protein